MKTKIIPKILAICLALIILAGTLPTTAIADTPKHQNTIEINNRVIATITTQDNLIPLRPIVEHLGGSMTWNSRTRQVSIVQGSRRITLNIGSTRATVNNREVRLTTAPRIINGSTMVYLCFFANHMGLGAGHINNRFILSTTPARRIPVVTYHHILPDEMNTTMRHNPWVISTENFQEQMRYLYDNNFYTPTLDELEAFIYQGRPLPARSVMIHFDDGYYSNYVYARPILLQYGLRAVLFPITAHIVEQNELQRPFSHDSLVWLSEETLRRSEDVFETASHAHYFHALVEGTEQTRLTAESKENIIEDTLRSFEFLTNHRAYAYPRGQYNATVIAALREVGITMAFTINNGYITSQSDPFRLNRFLIFRCTEMPRFRNIVNGRL